METIVKQVAGHRVIIHKYTDLGFVTADVEFNAGRGTDDRVFIRKEHDKPAEIQTAGYSQTDAGFITRYARALQVALEVADEL